MLSDKKWVVLWFKTGSQKLINILFGIITLKILSLWAQVHEKFRHDILKADHIIVHVDV